MASVNSARRFYLHKRIEARQVDNDAQHLWKAKQEAQPGNALAASFPSRTALASAGYTTDADLDGVDENELVSGAGLSAKDAQTVVAAAAAFSES